MNDELQELYEKLLKAQQPLGEEFEKVLYENLTELYVTDEEETNAI